MTKEKGILSNLLDSEATVREFRGENAGGLRALSDLGDESLMLLGVMTVMTIAGAMLGDEFGGTAYAWGGGILGFILGGIFFVQIIWLVGLCMLGALVFYAVDMSLDHRVEHKDPQINDLSSHPYYSDVALRAQVVCREAYKQDEGWFHGWKIEELDDWEYNIACTTFNGSFDNCALGLPGPERMRANKYLNTASKRLRSDKALLAETVEHCDYLDAKFTADNEAMMDRDQQIIGKT